MLATLKKKYIGDKAFYAMILAVALPIMVQNGITNFVNLLDNIMVGQIGTDQMSGIAIANQLFFVYNICLFGGVSGAGIFTAQYVGSGNHEGVRYTFRFKFWCCLVISILATVLFLFAGPDLIRLYLSTNTNGGDPEMILSYGYTYLKIITIGLVPFMLVSVYASTLRENGETVLPMKASMTAVFVNLVFNYLLIFGNFGFPKLGVAGAAIATSFSRYVEIAIILIWCRGHKQRFPFLHGLYKHLGLPVHLAKEIIIKGSPLMINEALWAIAQTTLIQCYSQRSLLVVPSINIASTFNNLFFVVFLALGSTVSIIIGQLLGAGKMEEAVDTDRKLIAFSTLLAIGIGIIFFILAPVFPQFYNTDAQTKLLATRFMIVYALFMPVSAYLNCTYFTVRTGGKTIITFLFDSAFAMCVSVPTAYLLIHFTNIDVVFVLVAVFAEDLIKCAIGTVLVVKGIWLNNIVKE